jgi:alkylation response protein AidB-like acyl-CoA dehydrogenase
MGLAISEEHQALGDAAVRWTETYADISRARATLDAKEETLPPFWDEIRNLGWLRLAVAEDVGGDGFGLAELTVVLEALGRTLALSSRPWPRRRSSTGSGVRRSASACSPV